MSSLSNEQREICLKPSFAGEAPRPPLPVGAAANE
jgi:hypothetical protein